MLREYRLTNFKAFGETVTIPIRPLTLIFGANSSGKSSIFQSLLLLKQTLEEAKNPETALLPKGSLVDLGTYSDFVHRHETDRNFEFGACFDLEGTNKLPLLAQKIIESVGATKAGLTVQFSSAKGSRVDLAIGEQRQAIISYFRHRHPPTLKHPRERFSYSEEAKIKPELKFWHSLYTCTKSYITSHLDDLSLIQRLGKEDAAETRSSEKEEETRGDDFFEKLKNYQFEDAIKDIREALPRSQVDYENFLPKNHTISRSRLFQISDNFSTDWVLNDFILNKSGLYNWVLNDEDEYIYEVNLSPFVSHICCAFRHIFEDLVYLGPLRSHPERHYEFSDASTDYVGQSGERLPSILFKEPSLLKKANGDLERLGVKYQVKLDKLQYENTSPSNVFSLRLVDTETGIDASLRDVGFGISQVLPIVVQNRLSEKKTLLIEQPEIHLHPAHQAELGDLFIKSAKERGNTLLLETHSEHLLLRIMRRMRETSTGKLPEGAIAVRPEDVMVLFVESDGSQSIVREMPLNERGELVKAWPGGFFEEGLREIL